MEGHEDLPDYADQPPYVMAARARAAAAAMRDAVEEGGVEGDADLGDEFQDFEPEFVGIDDVKCAPGLSSPPHGHARTCARRCVWVAFPHLKRVCDYLSLRCSVDTAADLDDADDDDSKF